MSVDFYHCDKCKRSVYEEYVGECNKCHSSLCTDCLVNNDVKYEYAHKYGYRFDSGNPELMSQYEKEGFSLYRQDGSPRYDDGDVIDDSMIDSKYCPFCSGESINKELLFDFIVTKFKVDVNKEWKLFKNQKQ